MTDQTTPAGAPGTPAGNAPAPSNNAPASQPSQFNFLRQRGAQLERTMQPAPSAQPAADAGQQQQQPQPQQTPPAGERTVDQELAELRAFRAEQDIRKNTLPKTENEYLARNSESFKLPPGARPYAFNEQDPTLAAARRAALKHGLSQEAFSDLLDVYAADRAPRLEQQQAELQRSREANLSQLGSAANLRVDAVATWLAAKAGNEGSQVAAFIRQYPSAPIVKAMESLIKQFSSQRAASSQQSESAPADTRIPGYSGMSMVQIRATQIAERIKNDPNYATGGRRGE